MPCIIYSDTSEPYTGGPRRLNPTRQYMRHMNNLLTLQFIAQKTSSFVERLQAEKEIAIAEAKLDRWRRHPEFDAKQAGEQTLELRKNWGVEMT